jgi:hypothetical protein
MIMSRSLFDLYSGGTNGGFSSSVNTNYGFYYSTNLASGSYQINLTISAFVPAQTVSTTLQLLYAVQTGDGSNSVSTSGYNENGFYGTVPAIRAADGKSEFSENFLGVFEENSDPFKASLSFSLTSNLES